MSRTGLVVVFAGVASLLAANAPAQDAKSVSKSSSSSVSASFGLAAEGDALEADGPDYKARFDSKGWSFTPALGRTAPHDFPVSFALESIGRGDGTNVAPSFVAAPIRDGLVVRYARGAGISESYEVRRDGIEQAFRFAAPLEGHGDLVVRGRLSTELDAFADGDGVRFAHSSGGVRFGALTGVDAEGARVTGSIVVDGAHLELRLPGAWLDHAAYPVVLDPLVGTYFNISATSASYDDQSPDVAYDTTNAVYCVAWQRTFSATDIDIRAQRVATNGALVGGLIALETASNTLAQLPSIADVNATDHFLVAWEQSTDGLAWDVFGRSIAAATGTASTGTLPIANSNKREIYAVVGGEATLADDEAMVCWMEGTTDGVIRGCQVTVPAAGDPANLGGAFTISSPGSGLYDTGPRISKCGGSTGEFLVIWQRVALFFPLAWGRFVDRDGNFLGPQFDISQGTQLAYQADVDGDGKRFLVTYSDTSGIHGNVITAANPPQVGPVTPIASDATPDTDPVPSFTGDEYVVAWQNEYSATDHDIYVKGVDPLSCLTCEAPQIAIYTSADQTLPGIASQWSGGLIGDGALIAWGSGDIEAIRWQAKAGTSNDLGGGCGGGGTAHATCSKIANANFQNVLTGATPGKPALLLLGFHQTSVPCGSCKLIVDPNVAAFLINVGVTDANGSAVLASPIPDDASLSGLIFYDQWIVDTAPASCSGVDFSSAVSVRIEL